MKRQLMHTALIATTIFGSGLANAHNNAGGAGHTFEERARVTNVKEITKRTRTRTPRKECWNEQVQTYNNCSNNGSYEEYDHHSSNTGGSYGSSNSGNGSGDYQEGRYDGTVGAVAGGAIGGAIGHQFGKGKGKKAATIVGAIAGAVIGSRAATKNGPNGDYYPSDGRAGNYANDHDHNNYGAQYSHNTRRCEPQYKTVRKCRTIYDDSYTNTVVGYRVTYRYKGQSYETRTKNRPGRYIRLRVTIQPIDE